ncbi:MAG TPA: hypothetical protein VJY34_12730 [Roseiarcus sp.]|nr:hypothetical protein [Roseiarcus sp.]
METTVGPAGAAYPWLWGPASWDGFGQPSPAPDPPVAVADGGAPLLAVNVYPGVAQGAGDRRGGCVIHQLKYDGAGKYVGERQTPYC